ncbi:MAG: indole-3-glycerol phosphate synthase TrpC [Chloroflexi bacterium]|nr:indole-3-glycerol phosphate synthase TrpC [Chloroflexota bacterium]
MSVSNLAKRRGQILDEIMTYHRERLPKVMRETPLADVRAMATVAPLPADFYAALQTPGVSLIAECKKASPSKGLMVPNYDPVKLGKMYVKGGAKAISVLTDGRHFQGTLAHLRDVKEAVGSNVPVLRKDFIFHPYQIYEARTAGADAILLIVTVLSDADLKGLLNLTHKLGMNALVEVHSEEELSRALAVQPHIIGVNNRNLQTFAVDFANTARLRQMIPADVVVVGESGLKTAADVHEMKNIGVDAILVGEALVKSKDVLSTVKMMVKAGRP